MILYRVFPLCIFGVGVFAGIFRICELNTGFTAQGLAVENNFWRILVLILAGIVFLLTIVLSVYMNVPKKRRSPLLFIEFDPFAIGFYYLGFAVFFLAAIVNIYWAFTSFSISWLISGILLFFAAVSLIPIGFWLRRGLFKTEFSFLALIPVFWACYHLILHFRQDTQNPVIAQYMISVFAMAFLVLNFHSESGMLFSKRCAKRLYFSAVMNLFFNTVFLFEITKRVYDAACTGLQENDFSLIVSGLISVGAICFSSFSLFSFLRKKVPSEYETTAE